MGNIERGKIVEVTGSGYIVESLDRKGIVSPPITPIDSNTYAVTDMVLFVLFNDGTGKIISIA